MKSNLTFSHVLLIHLNASTAFVIVHTNEEFSAFHGTSILQQAEYANEAIKFILSLYKTNIQPSAVTILAHSMGGIVASTLVTLPNYQRDSVNTIFTFATPHLKPPIPVSLTLENIYGSIRQYWADKKNLEKLLVVSISGGNHDWQINSDTTQIPQFPNNFLSFHSTSIPHVWASADHKCILWCNQLVKAVSEALYDIVDPKAPTKTIGLNDRILKLRDRFQSGFARSAWRVPTLGIDSIFK